jgi:hypothetical protein
MKISQSRDFFAHRHEDVLPSGQLSEEHLKLAGEAASRIMRPERHEARPLLPRAPTIWDR